MEENYERRRGRWGGRERNSQQSSAALQMQNTEGRGLEAGARERGKREGEMGRGREREMEGGGEESM